jgi:hypothetical protein
MRRDRLLEFFQDFVLELFNGCYMTQLTAGNGYVDIHCQVTEDLQILKLDQCNGQLVEFPISKCTSLYTIAKVGNKNIPISGSISKSCSYGDDAEFQVVVEWERRALVFVFKDLRCQFRADRFLVCMELLVANAKQKLGTEEFYTSGLMNVDVLQCRLPQDHCTDKHYSLNQGDSTDVLPCRIQHDHWMDEREHGRGEPVQAKDFDEREVFQPEAWRPGLTPNTGFDGELTEVCSEHSKPPPQDDFKSL